MTMKCVLTGKEVYYERSGNHHSRTLNIAGNEVDVFICSTCLKDNKIQLNAKFYLIIEGLIANKKWPERCEIVSSSCTLPSEVADSERIILPDYLQTAEYPKNPKEKLEHLFMNLFNRQTYDGELFHVDLQKENFLLKKLFSESHRRYFLHKWIARKRTNRQSF